MQSYTYNDVLDRFKQNYPIIATNINRWHPSGKNAIVVMLSDGSEIEYHSISNSIRNVPKITDQNDFTEDNYQREFSYNLMNKMLDAGVDQSLLSEKTGISQSSISKYLHRKALPNIYKCEKIARALNCSINELTK